MNTFGKLATLLAAFFGLGVLCECLIDDTTDDADELNNDIDEEVKAANKAIKEKQKEAKKSSGRYPWGKSFAYKVNLDTDEVTPIDMDWLLNKVAAEGLINDVRSLKEVDKEEPKKETTSATISDLCELMAQRKYDGYDMNRVLKKATTPLRIEVAYAILRNRKMDSNDLARAIDEIEED